MKSLWIRYKKVILIVLVCFTLYLFLKPTKYNYTETGFIPDIHPEKVWEFVADFSNMKYLNPTIKTFNILSESGNYEHWKYVVEYTEDLSHWPYLSNTGVGYFDIKALPKQEIYFISSTHNTCFLFGMVCLQSDSHFKFSRSNSGEGVVCEEFVQYSCSRLWSGFCEREVAYQRHFIMKNLKTYFLIPSGS